MDRRRFLSVAGAGVVGGALLPDFLADTVLAGEAGGMKLPSLSLFSKHVQFLDYAEMADAVAALGFDGVDLTVRRGGHVEPDNYKRDLPVAVSAIKAAGLRCDMMATNIVSTDNQRDYELLALARSLGIKSYRTAYLRYDDETPLMMLIERHKRQLGALAEWNEEIGITGMYQNHAGSHHVGAGIWDLYLILKDLNPEFIGVQFDIRHATADGGTMWPTTLRLIKPHIRSLAIKDFVWGVVDGGWRIVNVPMGEGMVDFPHYFRMLKDAGLSAPMTLHCEYDLGGAEKGRKELTKPRDEVLAAIRQDVVVLNKLWDEA